MRNQVSGWFDERSRAKHFPTDSFEIVLGSWYCIWVRYNNHSQLLNLISWLWRSNQIYCRTALRAPDGVMSHRMNLRVGCRTALRAVVPMSGVGKNLLHIRGGLFFTLWESSLLTWFFFLVKAVTLDFTQNQFSNDVRARALSKSSWKVESSFFQTSKTCNFGSKKRSEKINKTISNLWKNN